MKSKNASQPLSRRPRRNRKTASIRDAVAETNLSTKNLVYPLFVSEGLKDKSAIKSMPGLFRWPESQLLGEIEKCLNLGLNSFALFPAISEAKKNSKASEAINSKGLAPRIISAVKKRFPEALVYADVALDPFSSDGHDGLVKNGEILNDETVLVLQKMSILYAESGADFVCPSDMMDGRIGAIRAALDEAGFTNTSILSYCAKYCSSFYGPFREALDSAPRAGDKKTYQMNFRNRREARIEAELDIAEGADIIMVKPALSYLDVICELKSKFSVPVAAYNVSGEYAMVKFAGQHGAIDATKAMLEVLLSIRRAGADLIFTYHAKEFAAIERE